METVRIVFISLTAALIVPNLCFFFKKMTLINNRKYNSNDFVIISKLTDNIIALATEILFSILVISLNICDTLNLTYNLIFFSLLIIVTVCQIIICRKKLIIKNNKIKVIPTFGKAKQFDFTEIDHIKKFNSTKGVILYTVFQGEREIFAFSDRDICSNLFIDKVRTLCIKITNVE